MNKVKYISTILAVVLGLSMVGCGTKQIVTPTPTPTTTTIETPIAETVKAKEWQTVKIFKGSSIKTTQKFTVTSDEWRIVWSTTPVESIGDMNFQIYVNDSNGDNISVAANIIGKGNDESYMTGSGEYSLMLNSAQNYVVKVEENK